MKKEMYRYIADNLRLAASKLDELGELSETHPTNALVGLAFVMSATGEACNTTDRAVTGALAQLYDAERYASTGN